MSESTVTTPITTSARVAEQSNLPPGPRGVAGAKLHYWLRKLLNWPAPVAILLLGALLVIPALLQKWLWMRQLDYDGIFWTLLSVKWGMTCFAFIGAFLFLWINLRQAARNAFTLAEYNTATNAGSLKKTRALEIQGITISRHVLMRTIALAAAAVAAFFALGFYTQWDTYLRFRYGGSFGFSDPIFGVDVGFYLFGLPFYQLLQGSLVFLTALAIVGVASQFAFFAVMRRSGGRQVETRGNAVPHLSVLLFILVATFGWGYYLDRYDLLYSTRGVVYGVGYTADHVTIIALWIMIGASAAACALLVLNFFRPRFFHPQGKALAIGAGAYVALYVTGIVLVPALVQKFVVQPNELRSCSKRRFSLENGDGKESIPHRSYGRAVEARQTVVA